MGSHAVLALSDESGDLVVRDVCRIGDAAAHHDPGVPGRRQVLAGSHWAQARRVRQPLLMLAPSSAAMSGTGLRADVCRVAEVAADSPIAVLPLSPGRGDLGVLVVVWDAEAETMPEETMVRTVKSFSACRADVPAGVGVGAHHPVPQLRHVGPGQRPDPLAHHCRRLRATGGV